MGKSCAVELIHQKYYPDISTVDFNQIVLSDRVTSNLQKSKLGKYAKWMLHIFRKKALKMEDLYKAQEYLPVFDKLSKSNKIAEKDLYKYHSLSEIYNSIKPFLKKAPFSKTEKKSRIKRCESRKLYEDDTFIVIHLKTRAASCLYGKGTQWCTAAKHHESNAFQYYNARGKLYVLRDKLKNRKYQFHFETDSFMDETDAPLAMTVFDHIGATNGLIFFFMQERSNQIFFLQRFGWGQKCPIYIAARNNKYGLVEPNGLYVTIICDFYYDEIAALSSYLAILKRGDGVNIYNLSTNKMYSSQNLIEHSPSFIKGNLLCFFNRLFPIEKKDFWLFLYSIEKNVKRKNLTNCIIANAQTISILQYFSALPDDEWVSPYLSINEANRIMEETIANNSTERVARIRIDRHDVWLIQSEKMPVYEFMLAYSEALAYKNGFN
jgi:hypothetical protein